MLVCAAASRKKTCQAALLISLLFLMLASGKPALCKNSQEKSLENQIRATLPVELRCSGSPAFGYLVAKKQTNPDRVMVKGPASSIEKISFVQTHPLNITGAVSTIEKEVPLDLPEDLSLAGNGKNARINARVVIEKQLVEKTFENIPVQMVNNIYPGIVQPNSVTLTIRGSMLFLANEFSADDIQVKVDLKGMGPGIHVMPVEIRLPGQTDLLRIDPQVFTVRILPQPSSSSGGGNASGS